MQRKLQQCQGLTAFPTIALRLITAHYPSRRAFVRVAQPDDDEDSAQAYLALVLHGKRPPPLDHLEAWATALDLVNAEREAFIQSGYLAHAPPFVRVLVEQQQREIQRQRTELANLRAAARPAPEPADVPTVPKDARVRLPARVPV